MTYADAPTDDDPEAYFSLVVETHEGLHKQARYIHPLVLLTLGIIEPDEACEMANATREELTAAMNHDPMAQAVGELAAWMRSDRRADDAIVRKRLQAILRDPAASDKNVLSAASSLRLYDDTRVLPMTEAQARWREWFRLRNIEIVEDRTLDPHVRAHAAELLLAWELRTRMHHD